MEHTLAQYTIRSKQEYIFRSNRVAEIMGASENISRSWDILYAQAEKTGKKVRRLGQQDGFDINEAIEAFESGRVHMIELFCGGGNDTVLFDSWKSFCEVNMAFSRCLLEKFPGMIPMAVGVEYTGDYQYDYASLMEEADREKNCMISGQSSFILPFSMMDRNTFQPYSRVFQYRNGQVRMTEESYSKRIRGWKISREDPDTRLLDNIVTQKGEESLLAVVHADGNNMGIKISRMLKGKNDYNFCISKMRQFTADTANAFTVEGLQAMQECREQLRKKYFDKYHDNAFLYRKIIADGDDMTFICNARFAMEYVTSYLRSVQNYQERHGTEWEYSSCAGICIFHGHYPFARAYLMAEQACDSAKEMVHGSKAIPVEEGWADFHYIHSGIGGNLDSIREDQGTADCMARPWRISGDSDEKDERSYKRLQKLDRLLREYSVSRSDIKTVGSECESGFSYGERELIRIYGHHDGLRKAMEAEYPDRKQLLRIWYDLSEMYDLWFKEADTWNI